MIIFYKFKAFVSILFMQVRFWLWFSGETFPPDPRFFRGRHLEQNCNFKWRFFGTRNARTYRADCAKMKRSAGVLNATSFYLETPLEITNSVTQMPPTRNWDERKVGR